MARATIATWALHNTEQELINLAKFHPCSVSFDSSRIDCTLTDLSSDVWQLTLASRVP